MFKLINERCLKCKYRLKQETIRSEKKKKNVATEKNAFIESLVLSFKTLKLNNLC